MSERKTRAAFCKGDNVVYTSNSGASNIGVILKVHFEDDPPFYTIHITETGIEKQTDEKNLVYLPLFDDNEDEDHDSLSPPAVTPATVEPPTSQAVAKPHTFGLVSLGVVGVAMMGLLLLGATSYSKNMMMTFKRR